jgi:hypothetical protein
MSNLLSNIQFNIILAISLTRHVTILSCGSKSCPSHSTLVYCPSKWRGSHYLRFHVNLQKRKDFALMQHAHGLILQNVRVELNVGIKSVNSSTQMLPVTFKTNAPRTIVLIATSKRRSRRHMYRNQQLNNTTRSCQR